jgi:hypothetical protein
LPYCSPPALCGPCLKNLGGTKAIHANCEGRANERNIEYAKRRARLEAGDARVCYRLRRDDGLIDVRYRDIEGTEVSLVLPKERADHDWFQDAIKVAA